MSEPLAPPEPQAVTAVAVQDALGKVPVPQDVRTKLDADVKMIADEMALMEVDSPEFKARIGALEALGNKDIQRSSMVANRLLERPTASIANMGGNTPVAKSLLDLRNTVERLDPSKQDFDIKNRIMAWIPGQNKVKNYFQGFQSSQSHLNAIIETLRKSKDDLLRDNAAIEQEKENMWKLMGDLERHGYLARALGDVLEQKADELENTTPERSRALREEAVFVARQKQQDIATQMAVNVQGYMALDLIKTNNKELAKSVDRATTTTVAALRTAIITAQAVANQKLVLDQVNALRDTTGNLIQGTARMLKENATQIQQGATNPTVDIEKLKSAFRDVTAAIDGMSTYRIKALAAMETTVDSLSEEVGKAKLILTERRDAAALAAPADAGNELLSLTS